MMVSGIGRQVPGMFCKPAGAQTARCILHGEKLSENRREEISSLLPSGNGLLWKIHPFLLGKSTKSPFSNGTSPSLMGQLTINGHFK
jgi:hypothetical protein